MKDLLGKLIPVGWLGNPGKSSRSAEEGTEAMAAAKLYTHAGVGRAIPTFLKSTPINEIVH